MKEKWLPVVGYEGVYSVSDRGRVRRDLSRTYGKAGKILKPTSTIDISLSTCARMGFGKNGKFIRSWQMRFLAHVHLA